MTDEEMEIESYRYSSRAFFVLPLSTGNIAVLHPNRSLYCVCSDWESAKDNGLDAEADQLKNVTVRERYVEHIESLGALDIEGLL